jgi:hypothetical protein
MKQLHQPSRGSDVEAWLKAERDKHLTGSRGWRTPEWSALDSALEDYRLRADTGLYLHQDIEEAGPHAEKS